MTTDEDRERKAENAGPGTYNVVVNPDSFQHLPEYSDDADKSDRPSLRRGSLAVSLASSIGREPPLVTPGDPNIIVLRQFEDISRRVGKDARTETSPTMSKIKLEDSDNDGGDEHQPEPSRSLLMQDAIAGGPNSRYLVQFREVVWKQLAQAELEKHPDLPIGTSSLEVLEHHAMYFAPVSASSEQ